MHNVCLSLGRIVNIVLLVWQYTVLRVWLYPVLLSLWYLHGNWAELRSEEFVRRPRRGGCRHQRRVYSNPYTDTHRHTHTLHTDILTLYTRTYTLHTDIFTLYTRTYSHFTHGHTHTLHTDIFTLYTRTHSHFTHGHIHTLHMEILRLTHSLYSQKDIAYWSKTQKQKHNCNTYLLRKNVKL